MSPSYNKKLYSKQDKDYTQDDEIYNKLKSGYKGRYKLYEQLIKENYHYIIKLQPKRTCIMKWGDKGIILL